MARKKDQASNAEAGKPAPSDEGSKSWSIAEINERIVGIGDPSVVQVRLSQIRNTVYHYEEESEASRQAKLKDLRMTLIEMKARGPFERALVGQMIASHHAAMECYRRAALPEQSFEARQANLKHAERLSATYARLLDALNKHRGKGQQKVTVKHVYVAAGGQAIVGNVDTQGTRSAVKRRKVAPPQIEHHVAPSNPLEDLKQKDSARKSRRPKVP